MRLPTFITAFALFLYSCDGPNHAASNQISTAPNSMDPTETIPSTGTQPVNNNNNNDNRIRSKTGTAPANESLPTGRNAPVDNDSTSKR